MNSNYSIFKRHSKNVRIRSQSAGNPLIGGTSETLCNEIQTRENIKSISDHVPRHCKPITDQQFGYYLAGLIDGDGHFSSQNQLVIAFDELSVSLAYFLKKKIGHGNVYKVKEKKAYIYVLAAFEPLCNLLKLINNKLRLRTRFVQVQEILKKEKFRDFSSKLEFKMNETDNFENYWLAGFSDADASFQIKILNKMTARIEIRLNFQIDQKTKDILIAIRNFIGGNIGYRSTQDTYYYGSTSFGCAKKIICYFDKFHLQSNKQINYLKWRKAYILVQKREHLMPSGIEKIRKLKDTMNDKNNIIEV